MEAQAYNVPVRVAVLFVFSSPMSLDKPKSAIFGVAFLSSSIFAGFKSKWQIGLVSPV